MNLCRLICADLSLISTRNQFCDMTPYYCIMLCVIWDLCVFFFLLYGLCCRVWRSPGRTHGWSSGGSRNPSGERSPVSTCMSQFFWHYWWWPAHALSWLWLQLASVILKQYVETHWCSQSEKFRPPETTDQVNMSSPWIHLFYYFFLSVWPRRTFCTECCQTLVSPSRLKLPLEGCCPAVCERQSAKSAPVLHTPCRPSPTGIGPRPGRSCSPCWWRCWLAEMSMLFMGPWGSSQVIDQTHTHTLKLYMYIV